MDASDNYEMHCNVIAFFFSLFFSFSLPCVSLSSSLLVACEIVQLTTFFMVIATFRLLVSGDCSWRTMNSFVSHKKWKYLPCLGEKISVYTVWIILYIIRDDVLRVVNSHEQLVDLVYSSQLTMSWLINHSTRFTCWSSRLDVSHIAWVSEYKTLVHKQTEIEGERMKKQRELALELVNTVSVEKN